MQATSKTLQKVQEAFMQKDIASTQESMTSETFFDQD